MLYAPFTEVFNSYMITTNKIRGKYNAANHIDYFLDFDIEFSNLPGLDVCAVGSRAYSAESGTKKILNSAGEWVEDKTASSGGGGGGGGTSDYADLENKPQINGVTLNGNKTPDDLDILPTASWTATVSAGFAAQSTTAEINGTSFTKVSDKAFTAEQLDGAVFSMRGSDVPITSAMLIDMSNMGVTGTMIDLTSVGFGPVVFSCTEAGNVVSEPGFYLASAMISYAPLVTISYSESLTAQTCAIGIGDMVMEDGVSDLPTGVVWLQYES